MQGDACGAELPELMSSDKWSEELLLSLYHLLKNWNHIYDDFNLHLIIL